MLLVIILGGIFFLLKNLFKFLYSYLHNSELVIYIFSVIN